MDHKTYLAQIGRKGGQVSSVRKRKASAETLKKARKAKKQKAIKIANCS